jgi:hypothetical protein
MNEGPDKSCAVCGRPVSPGNSMPIYNKKGKFGLSVKWLVCDNCFRKMLQHGQGTC